jgi:hypothetical protein
LFDFAIHRRHIETRSRKRTRVSACSQPVSRGYASGNVTLATLPIFFQRTTITARELSATPRI